MTGSPRCLICPRKRAMWSNLPSPSRTARSRRRRVTFSWRLADNRRTPSIRFPTRRGERHQPQEEERTMANRDALIRYLIKNVQREALPLHVEVFAQQLLADPNFVVAAEGFTVDAITDELVSAAFPMATYDAVLVPF